MVCKLEVFHQPTSLTPHEIKADVRQLPEEECIRPSHPAVHILIVVSPHYREELKPLLTSVLI